ncbi:hypothetical protein [Tumebacillus flagellatus]|uniref:Uncharacterized protein n=1 Tax=Tumebacillus flagellatus TaxID=1157490 RepID=A0A074LX68_9BACL|nr:hypothetical protein [Tumebacillus flagellatus]KEO84643.1 hypothetical protein EL26_03760 [Tumebacillus flagellatus]
MDFFARAVQGVVQFLQEAVEREWRSPEERRFHSQLQGAWFDEVAGWLERFAGHEIWRYAPDRLDEVRAYARGARDEVGGLLNLLEPQLATAVLCGLRASQGLGYTQERLAENLGVETALVLSWEREGYARLRALVSNRTPLLAFLAALAAERDEQGALHGRETDELKERDALFGRVKSELAEHDALNGRGTPERCDLAREPHETFESLLDQARTRPDFDLRRFLTPTDELELRRWFHRWGVESVFSEEGRERAAALVQARLKWEMAVGEEEDEDAGA